MSSTFSISFTSMSSLWYNYNIVRALCKEFFVISLDNFAIFSKITFSRCWVLFVFRPVIMIVTNNPGKRGKAIIEIVFL